MKVVILAAGFGSRMQKDLPKPLVPLFGLPLIEHKIVKLKDFEIAVVYHDRRVAEYIRKKYPLIKLIYNPNPEKENGYSLYCARDFISDGESFVLLMADHYYGDRFYSSLKNNHRTILFVSDYCYQPEEATKVKVKGDNIIKIGKDLAEFDYFDTGFFICTSEVFKYIEKLLHREKIKLSDIMQEMAYEGKLFYKRIEDFWIDIDTVEELKVAERFIKKSLIKPTDGPVSRSINRRISMMITPILVKFDFFTPNVITIFVSILGILVSFLFLFKYYALAGIITQLVSIIDGCDGEVARIKNLSSKFGAVLDSVLDRYVDSFFIFFIFLSLNKDMYVYVALFLALTGTILVSYVSHISEIRPYFATRDVRLFIIMIGGVLSLLDEVFIQLTLWVVGIQSHIAVFYSLIKKWTEEKRKTTM